MAPRLFGISLGWVAPAVGPAWTLLTGVMAFAGVHTGRQSVAVYYRPEMLRMERA